MKYKRLALFALVLLSFSGYTQISYDMNDFGFVGDTFTVSVSKSVNNLIALDSSGVNLNWDYSNVQPEFQDDIDYLNPDNAGFKNDHILNCIQDGGSVFQCNNQWDTTYDIAERKLESIKIAGIEIKDVVDHYSLKNNQLELRMMAGKINNGVFDIPILINFSEYDRVLSFPLNYLSEDSSISRYEISLSTDSSNIIYHSHQTRKNIVDAWGSIETPYKLYQNTIKLTTVITSEDTLFIQGDTIPLGASVKRHYNWFEKNEKNPVFTVEGLLVNQNFVQQKVEWLDTVRCLNPNADFYNSSIKIFNATQGNAEVNFNNLSLNTNDYLWDFGDGMDTTIESPTHIYSAAGQYDISLIACNDVCPTLSCDTFYSTVQIIDTSQVVSLFLFNPNQPCFGDTISFQNISIGANQFMWDFGDGASSTLEDPTHTYLNSGTYQVILIVTNGLLSDTASREIAVSGLPQIVIGNDTTIGSSDSLHILSVQVTDVSFVYWKPDPTLSCVLCEDPVVWPDTTTVYYVNGFNSCGTTTDSIKVTVQNVVVNLESGLIEGRHYLNIYPNPAHNRITIESMSGNIEEIKLLNQDGKLIKHVFLKHQSRVNISMKGLSKGVYFLEVQSNDGLYHKRVVKM